MEDQPQTPLEAQTAVEPQSPFDPQTPVDGFSDAPDAPAAPESSPPPKPAHSGLRTGIEWALLIAAALLIALLVKTFFFQAFYIPSDSMLPTLKTHDRVIVNKLSYRLHPVHRGDIVVFKSPPEVDPSVDDLVKRVIALPGETVEGRNDGHIYINGKMLKEPYLPKGDSPGPGFAAIKHGEPFGVLGELQQRGGDDVVGHVRSTGT